MNKDKLHIVLGVMLVLPVMYYFLYALPSHKKAELEFEQQKFEAEQNKIAEEKAEEELQEGLLNSCLLDADLSYYTSWETECSAWKVQVDDAWLDCRANVYSWQTDESNRANCVITTPDYEVDENGACLLPNSRSVQVDERVKSKKDECYKKYS